MSKIVAHREDTSSVTSLPNPAMALELNLRQPTTNTIDMRGVRPDALSRLSTDQIRAIGVPVGNTTIELGELFEVRGDPTAKQLVIRGELASADKLGAGMQEGELHVEGDIGHDAGARMSGGSLTVSGNASDNLGMQMRGGVIRVAGNVGHNAGGSGIGCHLGMQGGVILILGNAGDRVGCRMRRGLLAVAGDVGVMAGFEMRAGTIVIGARGGNHLARGMRRGTIILAENGSPSISKNLVFAFRGRSLAIEMVVNRLHQLSFPTKRSSMAWDFYHGDIFEGGRGEVVVSA